MPNYESKVSAFGKPANMQPVCAVATISNLSIYVSIYLSIYLSMSVMLKTLTYQFSQKCKILGLIQQLLHMHGVKVICKCKYAAQRQVLGQILINETLGMTECSPVCSLE